MRSRILVTMADAQVELGLIAEATESLDAGAARPSSCATSRAGITRCAAGPDREDRRGPATVRRRHRGNVRVQQAGCQPRARAAVARAAAPGRGPTRPGAGRLRGSGTAGPGRGAGRGGGDRHAHSRTGALGVRRPAGRPACHEHGRRGSAGGSGRDQGTRPGQGAARGRPARRGPGVHRPGGTGLHGRAIERWTWPMRCLFRPRSIWSPDTRGRPVRRPDEPPGATRPPVIDGGCWRPG